MNPSGTGSSQSASGSSAGLAPLPVARATPSTRTLFRTEQSWWSPLVWVNVLSLDAPAVALVWQALFARQLGIDLDWAARLVLGAAVWLAYAGDRILDGTRIDRPVSPRHQFAKRHRGVLTATWFTTLCASVAVAWVALPHSAFQNGLSLLVLVGVYFAAVHGPRRVQWIAGWKEGATGILFGLGTVVFLVPEQGPFPPQLWPPLALLCSLCFLNCCTIACWELDRDKRHNQPSLFTRWTSLQHYLPHGALALAALALLLAWTQPAVCAPIHAAIALSAALTLLLHKCSPDLGLDCLRVAADLVLLTPLLPLALTPAP